MATASSEMTITVSTDTRQVTRTCRIIAKHLAALADELEGDEQPDGLITVSGDGTIERKSLGVIRSASSP